MGQLRISRAIPGAGVAVLLASMSLAAPPKLISATYLGTPGDDDIEDVAIAPDGTIYVTGSTAAPIANLPKGVRLVSLGKAVPECRYGCAFVARFAPDGAKLLSCVQFARGVLKLTTVAAGGGGIYVGGYASKGIEPLLKPLGGLITRGRYDQRTYKPVAPKEHFTDDDFDTDNDQRGVPCVLRFAPDLSRLEAGTLLEGWQSVWHVPLPLREDRWQPTGIAVLPGGDVVVCHDGGYVKRPEAGETVGYEHFYYVPDYISRLSGDLKARRWKQAVYMPPMNRQTINKYLHNPSPYFRVPKITWRHDTIGQTRVLRMRAGAKGRFYLAGWSPSRTSNEPWWCPFLLGFDGDGRCVWRAYTPDPMSGGGGRLGGLVSDAAIRSVAVDADGNVLATTIGDGGNSVLKQDPRDYTKPAGKLRGRVHSFRGRTLFWGTVVRLDANAGELLGGHCISGWSERRLAPAWCTDVAGLPAGRALAVGRYSKGFHFTNDAWHAAPAEERPGQKENAGRRRRHVPADNGFLRVYGPDFSLSFSTPLPHVVPVTAAGRGGRCAVVGSARSAKAPVKNAVFATHAGGSDGYLMVVDVQE
jgi:hypothetical protein